MLPLFLSVQGQNEDVWRGSWGFVHPLSQRAAAVPASKTPPPLYSVEEEACVRSVEDGCKHMCSEFLPGDIPSAVADSGLPEARDQAQELWESV